MLPMPSALGGGARRAACIASSLTVAAELGERYSKAIDIAALIGCRRGSEVRSERRLRRCTAQDDRYSGGKIREDLVAETPAAIESARLFARQPRVESLCELHHVVGRRGIVMHERQGRRRFALENTKSFEVVQRRPPAEVKRHRTGEATGGANHFLEAAARADRLAEPVEPQRVAGVTR